MTVHAFSLPTLGREGLEVFDVHVKNAFQGPLQAKTQLLA
jgi:hypothetical protein